LIALHKNTVSDNLWVSLNKLMKIEELKSFRLVGGTSLSLQIGHRMSVDIDLFTDAAYDSIDFDRIDEVICSTFPTVEMGYGGNHSMGKSYFGGTSKEDLVKLDFFYTDSFVFPLLIEQDIRFARLEEIAAMKIEVIGNNGRKKDFWDLHELMDHFSLNQMIEFYEKRYPYSLTKKEIISQLTFFDNADEDFDPICLRNKYWELIKLDFEEKIRRI
jgi:predicted nucleotidyltransferase component of viral defense system